MTNLSQELISIIVPAYNSEQFIGECLRSIQNQTYHNWECIIIDDHSTDSTFEIALKYKEKDARFRAFKRPNSKVKGANSCRNFGLEKSKGACIKWFDSDDIMLKNHLEAVVGELSKNDLDFVVTESEMFGDDIFSGEKPYNYDTSIELNAENVALNRTGWITNDFTIKKASLGKLRFNESLRAGQEYNLNVRLLSASLNGKIINDVLSKYRQHEGTISHNRHRNHIKYLSTLLDIKYLTAKDLNQESETPLVKWFLAGYMRLVFDLARKRKIHKSLILSLPLIARTFGLFKTSVFVLGIVLGYFLNRGYNFVKYARQ
ncbi:glycosyltransferase family 2 protein [Flavobacteriaceae bacterium]|nr:glycosyltransferase family 2 protein [Flavobacteriaceae bacterium]